jgi:hypothetical protein
MRLSAGLISVLTLALMLGAPALSQEAPVPAGGFVPGVADLPLMEGLEADPNATLVFDKPEGRIVEAAATGAVSPEAVIAFYAATLPQLGWLREGPALYTREGEVLRITIEPAPRPGAPLRLIFAIEPQ